MEWKPVVLVLFPGSTWSSRLKGTLVQKAPHLTSVYVDVTGSHEKKKKQKDRNKDTTMKLLT